jgi:uncharacterized paraquat-inducible protein A
MSVLAPHSTLACPRCRTALLAGDFSPGHDTECPQCRGVLRAAVFPAFSGAAAGAAPDRAAAAAEGEAVCFFHPENRAERTCDRCGRFLCQVCDLPVGARRLCPACLGAVLASEKDSELVTWRFLWSDTALLLGLVPLVFGILIWPFLILTGIAAVVLGIHARRRPGSVPRGPRRWAAVLGLLGGLLQVLIWVGVLGWFFSELVP